MNKAEYVSMSAACVSYNLMVTIKTKNGNANTTGGINLNRINPITIVVLLIFLNLYLAKEYPASEPIEVAIIALPIPTIRLSFKERRILAFVISRSHPPKFGLN
jgi:hypothetical protein